MAAIHSFRLQKSPSRSFSRVSKRKQPGDPQLQVELSEKQVLELQIDREALISVEDIGVEGAENISLVHDLNEEEAQLASPSSQHAELADGLKEIVTDRLLSVAEIVRSAFQYFDTTSEICSTILLQHSHGQRRARTNIFCA
jgi:hypothetical protein